MLPLLFGLLVVLLTFGLILADMERKRRQLAEILDRLEPLVDRAHRLHLRNLRGLNNSLFYAYNLLESVEKQVHDLEQQRDLPPPSGQARFSLKPGRRLRDLTERLARLEEGHGEAAGADAAPSTPPAPSAPPAQPAPPRQDDTPE